MRFLKYALLALAFAAVAAVSVPASADVFNPPGAPLGQGICYGADTGCTNSTSIAITAYQWQACTTVSVREAGATVTLPQSTTLQANGGCLVINAIGNTVTLAINAADAINGGTTGASLTLASGAGVYLTTNGNGQIYAGNAAAGITTPVSVANGGTGLSSGTSGGVPAYTASGTITSSAALTANAPVIGGGAGAVPTVGSRSGNTTVFGTTSGALTSGNCLKSDASGNIIDAATTCGGGSGTVNSGTTPDLAYYATSTAAVSDGGTVVVTSGGINFATTSTPTLGVGQSAASTLGLFAAGGGRFNITSGAMAAANASGPQLNNAAVTSTAPGLIPDRAGVTTGWGAQAAGNISCVIVAVERCRFDNEGLKPIQVTAPVPTGTGSPTIATGSTDWAGEVTAGATAISVVITFNLTHANAPFCTVTSQLQLAAFAYTISTTAITITQTATTGNKIDYVCVPH